MFDKDDPLFWAKVQSVVVMLAATIALIWLCCSSVAQ